VRNARGVHMTEAGHALLRHVGVILARLADAEAELDAIAGARGGRVRLVAFPSAGATIAPRAIGRFRERYPGVEVTLEPREPHEGLDCLKCGDCDIALTVEAGFEPIEDNAIERHHLLDDPMYVCLPAGHRVAAKSKIKLSDLADEAWIMGATGRCPDGLVLERACQAAGFEPRVAFQSDDYVAIQGFIAAGVGVCLIPDLALVAVRDDIVIRPLAGRAPTRHVIAATLAGGFVSPACAGMLEILSEVGAEFQACNCPLSLAG
jgi:DNA-binding transcriptional LysR family regulator